MAELRLVRTWTGAHLQICVLSHLSPAVSWIVNPYRRVQKWSPLSEFMACPCSVTSALHLRCGTLFLPHPLNPRDERLTTVHDSGMALTLWLSFGS